MVATRQSVPTSEVLESGGHEFQPGSRRRQAPSLDHHIRAFQRFLCRLEKQFHCPLIFDEGGLAASRSIAVAVVCRRVLPLLSVNPPKESVHVSTQHDGGARNAGINDAEDTIRVFQPDEPQRRFFRVTGERTARCF